MVNRTVYLHHRQKVIAHCLVNQSICTYFIKKYVRPIIISHNAVHPVCSRPLRTETKEHFIYKTEISVLLAHVN